MKTQTTIDQHMANLRYASRIVAAALEDEEREILERLRGVALATQTTRRMLRDTDSPGERQARLDLYAEGLAAGQAVYFQRGA